VRDCRCGGQPLAADVAPRDEVKSNEKEERQRMKGTSSGWQTDRPWFVSAALISPRVACDPRGQRAHQHEPRPISLPPARRSFHSLPFFLLVALHFIAW